MKKYVFDDNYFDGHLFMSILYNYMGTYLSILIII